MPKPRRRLSFLSPCKPQISEVFVPVFRKPLPHLLMDLLHGAEYEECDGKCYHGNTVTHLWHNLKYWHPSLWTQNIILLTPRPTVFLKKILIIRVSQEILCFSGTRKLVTKCSETCLMTHFKRHHLRFYTVFIQCTYFNIILSFTTSSLKWQYCLQILRKISFLMHAIRQANFVLSSLILHALFYIIRDL